MKKIVITIFIIGVGLAVLLQALSTAKTGKIVTLTIEPSTSEGGWLMYQTGAKAVLEAERLKNAELRVIPTGTAMAQLYPNGKALGQMTKIVSAADGEKWYFALPDYLMTSSFFVVAIDQSGKQIKSQDLGQVGYQE